eukprot:tig00000704_g3347.t1
MFFHVELERTITLEPKLFGPKLKKELVGALVREVEGTCSGRYGFVVVVTGIRNAEKLEGKLREGTGAAVFVVKYSAIVFKPFKGEVLDAVVSQVNKMGFFADAGPLQIFVSNRLIPTDMTFDPHSTPPCYVSGDQTVKIQKDTEVRLKIVGVRVDVSEIFAIGSIKEDYLGALS